MKHIGICEKTEFVYGGTSNSAVRLPGTNALFPVTIIGSEISDHKIAGYYSNLFLESYYDPQAQIKKGAIYSFGGASNQIWYVIDSDRTELKAVENGRRVMDSTLPYQVNALSEFKDLSKNASKPIAVLGDQHQTFWQVISIESTFNSVPLVTLKAMYQFGAVPYVDKHLLPPKVADELIDAIEKVAQSALTMEPNSVVDRCREALSIVFSYLAGNREKDLAKAISGYLKAISSPNDNKFSYAAKVVARLHSQGKPSEQHKYNLSPLDHYHAQLALSSLWMIVEEVDWELHSGDD